MDPTTLLALYRTRGLRIATAESCTGGMIAAALTDIGGSSDVFERGFVTYSNEAKTEMLGVPAELIAHHGAVSVHVAREMALGALRHARADVAVAVTGIAGPGGGSDAKPVGLVYLGGARKGAARVEHHAFVVAVARSTRAVQHGEAIVAQSRRERVDHLLRSHRDRKMRQAHALGARFEHDRLQGRGGHQFEAGTAAEAQKHRRKTLGLVAIAGTRHGPEIRDVELAGSLQIRGPEREVLDTHAGYRTV